jgi:serine/threonine protein kinase
LCYSVLRWAYGITLYETLTNRKPFNGRTGDEVYTAMALGLQDELLGPAFFAPHLTPRGLLSLLAALLMNDRESRLVDGNVLRAADYFSDIDWEQLATLSVPNVVCESATGGETHEVSPAVPTFTGQNISDVFGVTREEEDAGSASSGTTDNDDDDDKPLVS